MPSSALRDAIAGVAAVALLWGGTATAQGLDVPVPWIPDEQSAGCGGSIVAGLDPNGDNFLAVRSGPGTRYAKIDELHTGDEVRVCATQGDWHGIYYFWEDGYSHSGWVHGAYLVWGAG